MGPETAHPVVAVFRSRLLADAEANGYGELAAHMEDRARAMTGFVDFKTFAADDGERLSVIVFDTIAHQLAGLYAERREIESAFDELKTHPQPTSDFVDGFAIGRHQQCLRLQHCSMWQ